jgi:uncharacterized protein YkwD
MSAMRLTAPVILALLLSGCTPETMTPTTTAPVAPGVTQATAPATGFGALLNAQRAAAGLSAAQPDPRLQAAAARHLADMRSSGNFSHTGSDGSQSYDRIAQAGFASCRPAENIAFGQTSDAAAMTIWMGSSGHRANILMSGDVRYGIASGGGFYVLTIARVC